MSAIAIFTNNLSSSGKIAKRIAFLGHEVYCTNQLVERIINGSLGQIPDVYTLFKTFVFSETLTDSEVRQLLSKMPVKKIRIFKESYSELSVEERERWESVGITDWLDAQVSNDCLREIISNKKDVKGSPCLVNEDTKECSIDVFDFYEDLDEVSTELNLTSFEKTFFSTLLNSKGKFITRSEMCLILWGKEPSPSYLTRVSQIARQLKLKLRSKGFEDKNIVTTWNLGYCFIPKLYEKVEA